MRGLVPILVLALALAAASERAARAEGGFVVDPHRADMKLVPEGDLGRATVTVTNEGPGRADYQRFQRGDAGIGVVVGPGQLAPGEAATVQVTLDTRTRTGVVEGEIVLEFRRAGRAETVSIPYACEVEPLYRVRPWRLDLGQVKAGARSEPASVKVSPVAADELLLPVLFPSDRAATGRVEATSPLLELSLLPGTQDGRKACVIAVMLSPATPVGPFRAALQVYTGSERQPLLEIPVTATVVRDFEVAPAVLDLGRVPPGRKTAGDVVVRATGERPVRVLGAEVLGGAAAVLGDPAVEGDGRRTRVRVTGLDAAPPGPFAGTLRIYLDRGDGAVDVKIAGEVVEEVAVLPRALLLTPADIEAGREVAARITRAGGETLRVLEVRCDRPDLLIATCAPAPGGNAQVLSIRGRPGSRAPPGSSATIFLRTDVASQPEMRVRVFVVPAVP